MLILDTCHQSEELVIIAQADNPVLTKRGQFHPNFVEYWMLRFRAA
jgi:hypothetical protein